MNTIKPREQLENEGIKCFLQDGSGITEETDLVVVSTAIEDTVYEVKKPKNSEFRLLKKPTSRDDCRKVKTVAVAGTSGKSTTSAMLFQILLDAGLEPSIISGAGLTEYYQTRKNWQCLRRERRLARL